MMNHRPIQKQLPLTEKTQLDSVPANDGSISSEDKPEVATGASNTSTIETVEAAEIPEAEETVEAVKPVEPQQAKIHKIATDTTPAITEITPGLMPVETVRTVSPVIAKSAEPTGKKQSEAEIKSVTGPVSRPLKTTAAADIPAEPIKTTQVAASGESVPPGIVEPAGPTGEKQSDTETKTAAGSVQQPLEITTAPDISAEPIETPRVTASEKPVLPVKAEPAAIDRSRAAPVKQLSPPPAQPSPGVKEATGTLALAKADPVIIQPEKSSKPAAKKPQKARVTSTATKTAGSASQTMNTLLANQWVTDTRQQAAQLPSFITNCSTKRGSIECWSSEHFIEKNEKPIEAKTKSYLRDFTKSGFTIRYKHMLLGGANEKRRWEDKTHILDCVISYGNKIKCREAGDNSVVIFTRNTSDRLRNRDRF